MSETAGRVFRPLIQEKLNKLGKVTRPSKDKSKGFTPDFIVESAYGKTIGIEVGCELGTRSLAPLYLCRRALQLQVYMQRFDRVFFIAPYEELRAVSDLLRLAGVRSETKLQTIDLGYTVELGVLDARVESVSEDLRKLKRAMQNLGFSL